MGVPWRRVGAFYALACLVSWPLFAWRDVADWRGFPASPALALTVIMWGPGLAALALWAWDRRRSGERAGVSLLGSSPVRTGVALGAPFVLLLALEAREAPAIALASAAALPLAAFRVLGEELGWRGYLQAALRPLPTFARFALVGVLWEAWHFTTRTWGRPMPQLAFVLAFALALAVAASVAIGLAVERSGAVLLAVAMHAWLNIAFEGLEAGEMRGPLVAVAAAGLWMLLLAGWPSRGRPTGPPGSG